MISYLCRNTFPYRFRKYTAFCDIKLYKILDLGPLMGYKLPKSNYLGIKINIFMIILKENLMDVRFLGPSAKKSDFISLEKCSDGRFAVGKDGVESILATGDRKVNSYFLAIMFWHMSNRRWAIRLITRLSR